MEYKDAKKYANEHGITVYKAYEMLELEELKKIKEKAKEDASKDSNDIVKSK